MDNLLFQQARAVYIAAFAEATPFTYAVLARHFAGLDSDTVETVRKHLDTYPIDTDQGRAQLIDDLRLQGLIDGTNIAQHMTAADFMAIIESEGIII